MKKVLALIAIAGFITFGVSTNAVAQTPDETEDTTQVVEDTTATQDVTPPPADLTDDGKAAEGDDDQGGFSITTQLKTRFIEGGPLFMGIVLLCLILGLALIIERIVYLNLATTNTKKLVQDVEDALASGGIEAAKEVCRNTRGPVASIFYQGLDRSDEGIDHVEKAVVAYGGVQMGLMEKGMSWIGLFIALAPMLGFMGTVIGMIQAFDDIANAGTISAEVVAVGIKVALLTTVFGLIVAIILQIFYNYLLAKIDSLVNDMEDASISLIDVLIKHDAASRPQ
ncbi:MotA/TolQ/ExbB proton channel family protein [Paracrocinitomix mangrovi]|uniref:MotA/TolQ/ExbB proton channel family protein n=1 Tax=Paracrocinitomix mangrovi TaxID=2862509 RepID=UPI001C8E1DB3|nr:MotA/TolQ/ExbB proton channel family protein [Paracrocinitomix mangrovi]UKN00690.1 MotA/TolQ/ExbB proton channel family protein [Paracrocinitomix mangrovi]